MGVRPNCNLLPGQQSREQSSGGTPTRYTNCTVTRMNQSNAAQKRRRRRLRRQSSYGVENHPYGEPELKRKVHEIERDATKEWHPTRNSCLGPLSPMLILMGALHPAFRHTHCYLLTDDIRELADLVESYLAQLSLYFSLVGVMATEFTLVESPVGANDTDSEMSIPIILAAVARTSWCVLAIISLTAVAAGIHLVWSLHSVPVSQRRRFILDHESSFSLPYAVAPLSFVLLFVGIITGGLSLAYKPQTFLVFRYAMVIGLVIGCAIAVPMVFTSGLVMESAFRPW